MTYAREEETTHNHFQTRVKKKLRIIISKLAHNNLTAYHAHSGRSHCGLGGGWEPGG